jgi:hypothetical protein
MALLGCLRVLPTVGFPVAQFNAIQQPLMAVRIVPFADIQTDEMPAQYRPLKP